MRDYLMGKEEKYASRRQNCLDSYSYGLTRELALVLAHGIDHKHINPKQIDQQPTKFLSELYCQKNPMTGQKSLYFSNRKIIPSVQESHQQEVGCSSGQAPEIASFPESISQKTMDKGNPFIGQNQGCSDQSTKECLPLPGQVVLVICGQHIMIYAMYWRFLPLSLPSFPNGSFISFIQLATNVC